MRLEKIDLLIPNVVHCNMELEEGNFDKGFEKMRNIEYQEQIYSNSVIAFKLLESDKNQKKRNVEFLMSISDIPPNFSYKTTKLLKIKNTVVLRQADLEKNLQEVRTEIEAYAQAVYGKGLGNEMYCLRYNIYNESLLDVYIPMKKGIYTT